MIRTRKLPHLTAAAVALTLCVGAARAGAPDGAGPIATGGGTAMLFNPFNPPGNEYFEESFAFTAIRMPDGSVSGQAQFNIFPGVSHIHMDIDSAVVDADGTGTVVFLGGIVTGASNPDLIGRTFGFAVSDGGSGPNAGDKIGPTTKLSNNTFPDVWSFLFTLPFAQPYGTFGEFFLATFFNNGPDANVVGSIEIH